MGGGGREREKEREREREREGEIREEGERHWLLVLCTCNYLDSKGYLLISMDTCLIVSYECMCLDPWS